MGIQRAAKCSKRNAVMTLTAQSPVTAQRPADSPKRDTRVGTLDAGMSAQIAARDRSALPYALYLATHASPAGDVIDSRALAAEHFHVTIRTITRWRASLVDAGYLLPYAGGHKGKCLRAVIKRFLSDSTAFIARRALAALWLARKARNAERARRARMNPRTNPSTKPKGDIDVSRLISQESSLEDSAESTLDERPERDAVGITGHAADLLAAMRAQLPRNGRVSSTDMRVVRRPLGA
jgi:hypothetical protein